MQLGRYIYQQKEQDESGLVEMVGCLLPSSKVPGSDLINRENLAWESFIS